MKFPANRRFALAAALALILGPLPAMAAEPASTEAPRPDSRGFGDAQFDRMMQSWQAKPSSVPSLSAIYEATAPKRPRAPADATSANLVAAIPQFSALADAAPLRFARLTSQFGMRIHPLLGGLRAHKGIDLAAAVGTPIRATADGIVRQAAWTGGYGLLVAIDHGGHMETRYGHMSRLAVTPGEHVTKDSVIGYVGSTGRSTGPHLHYEVLIDGRAVDPMSYMR